MVVPPGHCDIAVRPPPLNSPVMIGGTTLSPTCGIMGSQEILSIHGSTGSTEIGDTQNFNTSIDGNFAENRDSIPVFSKVIRREQSQDYSADIYSRCRVDLTSNAVVTEAPYFIHLGIPAVNALDELRSCGTPVTRVRRPMGWSNWSAPSHVLEKLQQLE